MYMIIVGGGNVGLHLAKKLVSNNHEVLLLERDSRQAQRLSQLVGEENVMVGDGCEMTTQKDAGFERADVVIAVTGEDEDNMVVCQLAKIVWNVKRVLARVNDPAHESLFQQIGIDDTVSATSIIHSLIEQQISPDVMLPVGALARGHLEIVEVEIGNRSPVLGKRIREIDLPPKTNLIWILREDSGLAVTGDTDLRVGDMLVALVSRDHSEELHGLFEPEKV
ncbi:MAG: TrkA family potassium uptake protein [Fimbriimonadaceae bacterium]